ncbi:Gfo/Idh/MocA family protein [Ferrimonas aestuarii]|uniref:Gfo/Idh/MocA family oxidoreductase n=1 Tax=Ferrimonas aestuarii TaxID=2569539 RepID=A0A4U1BMJ2_9GAMM|nr:Gfo/Idh/MocA family oxidoreductase [Ferrimonas aestuarii]TKB53965.1 Gfo/Idh/MocA family oxidoreductase [Ferrimonas aestuarii]
MSSGVIRVGVLGCANISDRFVIPAIKALTELYELVAVASRTKTKADQFADKYDCLAIDDYQELVSRDDIDLVYIPLPNSLHYEWVKKSLLSGKHVLVEKSLACNQSDVQELSELSRSKNLILMENFQFRFHSQLKKIKELIDSGVVGELRLVKSCFGFPPFPDANNIRYSPTLGGGALLDAGAYPIKVSQEILGVDLTVAAARLEHNSELEVDLWGSGQLIQKNSSVVSQISFGFDNFYQCNLEIWGSKGMIKANRIFTSPPGTEAIINVVTNDGNQDIVIPQENHFENLLTHLHECISEGLNEEVGLNINQARLIEEFKRKSCE